jgi:hypothetical protein
MPKSSASPECRHILTSGRKCHAIALRDRPFCYQHSRQRTLAADGSYKFVKLPPLEDHASILLALNQVMRAMTANRIDDKVAGRCLYAIQLAMQTIRLIEAQPPIEQVTDYLDGRFGDTVAVTDESRTPEDLYYLLSEYEKAHSSYGDNGWEPTNADYEPEPALPKTAEPELSSVPPESVKPYTAQPAAESSPSPVEPRVADPTKTAHLLVEQGVPGLTSKSHPESRPGGTIENSLGSKSWVAESNSEVPEGRPNPALASGVQRMSNGIPPDLSNAKTADHQNSIH